MHVSPRQPLLACAVLLLVVIFSLHFYPFDFTSFHFIEYDDEMFIRPMFNVGLSKYWSQWFPSPYTYAYPVRDMTFFFDQWLSELAGLQTYHYTSFLFYACTVILFSHLLALFFPGRPWLAVVALVWAFLHPLNVEIVQWVSARKNLMPTMFVMLGQLVVWRAWLGERALRTSEWAVLWLLQLASLACYPSSALWLVWVVALQWGRLNRRAFGVHMAAVVLSTWAYIRWTARGESDFDQSFGILWGEPGRVAYFLVRSLGRGFYNFILPHRLSMFYDPESFYNHLGFCLLLVYGGLVAFLIWRTTERRARQTSLALAGLVVALLLPQAHVFLSFADFRWADRYAFIVLPYFVLFNVHLLASSGALAAPRQRLGKLPRSSQAGIGAGLLVVMAGYYSLEARSRIPLWRHAHLLQEDCAAHEGAPKCIAAMISSTFMSDCARARHYIDMGFKRYAAHKPLFNDQLATELPFYDATCVALSASTHPADKVAFIPSLFDKYPGSPGPVFGLTLAYIEAGSLDEAWTLAQTYYLSGNGGPLGASKLLLQIYFGHTAALCELLGSEACWQKRRVLLQSNPQTPEKSPMVGWGQEITRLMHRRAQTLQRQPSSP